MATACEPSTDFGTTPPCAASVSDCLLPDYWFRLLIVPNGRIFSILPVFPAVPATAVLPFSTATPKQHKTSRR